MLTFARPFRTPEIHPELIQNALDEGATKVSFTVNDKDTLSFEHNGKPFNKADVERSWTRVFSHEKCQDHRLHGCRLQIRF